MKKRKKPQRPKSLTNRDYFAAMAMQGIASSITISRDQYIELVSESAVKYADALIAALAVKETGVKS